MSDRQDILSKIIGYIFFGLLICIVLSKLIYIFRLVPFVVGLIVCFILFAFCAFAMLKRKQIKCVFASFLNRIDGISYRKLLFLIVLLSLLTKSLAVFAFQINSIDDHSDINVYVTTSKELSDNMIAETYAGYCMTFSHMFWFAMFLSPITKIFGISQLAYSLFFVLIDTIVCVLLFDLFAFVFNKTQSFIVIMLYVLLPSQILLPQYITHENASLLFLTVSLWLYFKYYRLTSGKIKKIVLYSLSILALLLCSAINSLGIVAFVAFFIVFLIETVRRKTKKAVLKMLVKSGSLVLVFILGTLLMNTFQITHSKLSYEPNNNKMLWTLYVGSNYDSQGEWFDDKKWDDYPSEYTLHQINGYRKGLIAEHYTELLQDPRKLLDLIKNKMVNMWGTFGYSTGYTNETILNKSIGEFYNKILFKPLSFIDYGVLLILALLGCYKVWKYRKQNKDTLFVFGELFLLGSTLLLLITECRNKYTIMLIPLYIMVCIVHQKSNKKYCYESG